MMPLFEQPPNQEWPQGVSAGDLLQSYLSGEKSRDKKSLIKDLEMYCRRALDAVGNSSLMPLFGLMVVNAIVVLWMLGDNKLLTKVIKIESDEDGIIKKLFLIKDAYFPGWTEEE
jgi:hypothetical protein